MFGPDHTSYNPGATSISGANIANLEPVWRWSVPPSPNSGSTALFATPVSVGGMLYIGAYDGEFYAVNESSGQVVWSQFLGLVSPFESASAPMGIESTASVATDPATQHLASYVNAPYAYLYTRDASSCNRLWS